MRPAQITAGAVACEAIHRITEADWRRKQEAALRRAPKPASPFDIPEICVERMAADTAKVEGAPFGRANVAGIGGCTANGRHAAAALEFCYRLRSGEIRRRSQASCQVDAATLALRKLGIAFRLHTYVYDSGAESIGLQAPKRSALNRKGVENPDGGGSTTGRSASWCRRIARSA